MTRKPHQHELRGVRSDCNNPLCRLPFKLTTPSQGSVRRGHAVKERVASREEQHARYLDCGPQNWDDR